MQFYCHRNTEMYKVIVTLIVLKVRLELSNSFHIKLKKWTFTTLSSSLLCFLKRNNIFLPVKIILERVDTPFLLWPSIYKISIQKMSNVYLLTWHKFEYIFNSSLLDFSCHRFLSLKKQNKNKTSYGWHIPWMRFKIACLSWSFIYNYLV